jgi:hypothetical protein
MFQFGPGISVRDAPAEQLLRMPSSAWIPVVHTVARTRQRDGIQYRTFVRYHGPPLFNTVSNLLVLVLGANMHHNHDRDLSLLFL